MEFGFTLEQQAFREEVRAFLQRENNPQVAEEITEGFGPGPATTELYRKMGRKGWLTVCWPKEYGGLEGTNVQRLILDEELGYHRAYRTMAGVGIVGPTVLLHGSKELKVEFLPRISAYEFEFALGYTEPEAGSDLANLEMRAVEDGDDFVINGGKLFNSGVHYSAYHWLGVRTDPGAPKHKGISLFIVDLKSPGISYSPLYTLSGKRTNAVYYQDVRVPKHNLVGDRNRGFYHIATALDFERIFPCGDLMRDLDDLVAYVRETRRDGVALASDPLVRQRVAEVAVAVEAARLFSYNIAWLLDNKIIPSHQSSMLKLYVSETKQNVSRLSGEILGPLWELRKGSVWTQFNGQVCHKYLDNCMYTIVGGTSEIQRNIVATKGLGLPRG